MGSSFDAHILILDFSDSQLINLAYDLISPVEVTSFVFHPEHEKIIMGGCINGQVIVWDLGSNEHRVGGIRDKSEDLENGMEDDEEKSQQNAIAMKSLIMSQIEKSHKAYVSDMAFIPGGVKVDKKSDNKGLSEHFITVSEDGWLCIWDGRPIRKEKIKELESVGKSVAWTPFLQLQLFRLDGSPDLGLSKVLFEPGQTSTTFWAGSFEGELLKIDWSVKAGKAEGEGHEVKAENVRVYYDKERNFRPVLVVERSPFYPDLIMTVHDFNFCIWNTSLPFPENTTPIFRSANTFGSHNTCGGFSPSRPGVIFITKTDSIDVWDFYDQSNKASITLAIPTSSISYFRIQNIVEKKGKKGSKERVIEYMAYGELNEQNAGSCTLTEVPSNLSKPQENEKDIIRRFWEREHEKCDYVRERKATITAEVEEKSKLEAIRKAKEEATKDLPADAEKEEWERENELYLDLFY